MEHYYKKEKHVDNIGDIKSVAKPLETLSNARFNCSACHAPQSTATEAPKYFLNLSLEVKMQIANQI